MPEPTSRRPYVLVAEDEPGLLELFVIVLRRFCEPRGYQVRGVSTAAAIRAAVTEQVPAALVLDLVLPDQDGWTVLQQLRATPDLKDLPVIVLSAHVLEDDATQLGVLATLHKPARMADLTAAVRQALGLSSGSG